MTFARCSTRYLFILWFSLWAAPSLFHAYNSPHIQACARERERAIGTHRAKLTVSSCSSTPPVLGQPCSQAHLRNHSLWSAELWLTVLWWITKKLEEHSCVCDSARQREAEISAVTVCIAKPVSHSAVFLIYISWICPNLSNTYFYNNVYLNTINCANVNIMLRGKGWRFNFFKNEIELHWESRH